MFGISPVHVLGDKAIVWMLASEKLDNIKLRFARHSRYFINLMLEYYPYLHNYVDCRNKGSISWLKFCGATFEEPKPYGLEGKPFMYFSFKR